MDSIDEQWLDLGPKPHKTDIVAISNTGKYRRRDGTVGILNLRHLLKYYGELERCYRIIAENFLITVRRPDQICIDHISHHPTEYNVNDVRNLRWCTNAENSGFEEARKHYSDAHSGSKNGMYGKGYLMAGDKNPAWKGDNVGPKGVYRRANMLYKEGKITEEEFQPYRDKWAEICRARRSKNSSQPAVNLTEKVSSVPQEILQVQEQVHQSYPGNDVGSP